MAYIFSSTAVDGRGEILLWQQAIERFGAIALKSFLGHDMAHLVKLRSPGAEMGEPGDEMLGRQRCRSLEVNFWSLLDDAHCRSPSLDD